MKIFLLDLWHDLRAKRLWPVALGLALALVAVPVVLSKPSETAGPEPVETVRKAPEPKEAAALAQVKLESSADDARGSTLDTFDPSDPFKPPAKVTKKKKTETDAPSSVEGNTGGGAGAGTTGGYTGSTGGYTGSTGGYTAPTGGYTAPTGGGTTTTTSPQYRYVVDATFTANGRTRHLKGLQRLDMLPNQASPLLLFLGATRDGGSAVFLVDSSLQTEGEGKCKPKESECAFLYIGAGSENAFTNEDGDAYTLRIDEIRKVRADATAGTSRLKSAHAASSEGTAARGSATAPAPTITRVQSMRVSVGDVLTITGSHFDARRLANTLIFRGPNGRVAFAKPLRAATRKLVVRVPAAVSRLLQISDGAQLPTRVKLRVLSARIFSEFTSKRLSPVVTPEPALPDQL